MTLHLPLSPDQEMKLRERTAASGKDVTAYVLEAVEEELNVPDCLAELLAPIHAATRRNGTSEDEIDVLIEETRNEVYAQKRSRNI